MAAGPEHTTSGQVDPGGSPQERPWPTFWLTDHSILSQIADEAGLAPDDTVLEIGPSLGTLTSELL